MKEKSSNKKLVLGIITLVVLIAVLACVYFIFKPKGTEGSKNIQVEVIYQDSTTKTFDIKTDKEFLGEALKDEQLAKGEEGPFGLYIKEVDGVIVDDSKQEWWCLTKNKDVVTTGAESTPITDGDHYELTFTVGY